MRLLRELYIKEDIWTVKFVRHIQPTDRDGKQTIGLTCPADNIIYIKTGLKPKERWETYIHEVLHAIEFSWGFRIPHKLIYRLEKPLVMLLIENFIGPP